LRIGIDAHSVGMGAGGNETHYENLLRWIPRVDERNEYIFYFTHLSSAQAAKYDVPGRIHAQLLPWKSSSLRVGYTLPQAITRDRLDVFHAQYVLPPMVRCKTLLTVADLAFEHYPEYFAPLQRLRCKLLIPASARRADHILTVSEFSKRDICQRYNIDPERVTVTYHGADAIFRPIPRDVAREALASQYGLLEPFVLYVGRIQARKNLLRLAEAFAQLKEEGTPHKLVIVGKKDFQADQLIARVDELGMKADVIFPGYVPTENLPNFYSAADAFVFPSIFEGFGLPVIEAMACGAAVITSQGSSLEEVAGDACELIDPHSTSALTAALQRVLGDKQRQEELRTKGVARSRQFSYEDAARKVVAVYERLGATRP
jgi:glycosyltransferase involved in cell wall biosynthesis